MSYTFLADDLENCTSFVERVEVSSAECFSDIPAFVLSKLNLTAAKSCCNGSETESCHDSQSGTTCEPSMANRGEDSLTLCAGDFHAQTLVVQEKAQESTESKADYGEKCSEWFARLDQKSCSWKTHQCSLFEDLEESFVIWPQWGWMQDGVCLELDMPARLILGTEFGSWATPQASDNRKVISSFGKTLRNRRNIPELGMVSGWINPELSEWLMGWIINWTDLKPLEMDKFQQWLRSHGAL